MELFYYHLVKTLDAKDQYWRKHTVILSDGASYHTSQSMREFYK